MPDGIASFSQGGQQFYVTANEGDARDQPGHADEVRVGVATIDSALNTAMSAAHGADWRTNNDKLNRLTVSTSGDLDGDGDLDEIQVYGARSFSILDANGAMIFDSGDKIEQIIKASYMSSPTCTLSPTCLWDDTRSDNKGPEPESAVVGKLGNDTLLFLGRERSNAIMVWNLNNVANPTFVEMLFHLGDIAPEGLSFFVDGGYGYLAVSSEVSGSTSLYRTISAVPVPAAVWLLGSALGALGLKRRRV
jgi:3-phytase